MFEQTFVAFGDRSCVPLHSHCTAVGCRENRTFVEGSDIYGQRPLRETKPVDRYQYIQSFAQSVDIKSIMARYASGETDVLSRVQGVYADVASYPHDLRGLFDVLERAKSDFNSLPVSVREKFGYSFRDFLGTAGSSEWLEKVQRPADVFESEVDNEQK